jgi:hypothetical protein
MEQMIPMQEASVIFLWIFPQVFFLAHESAPPAGLEEAKA